MSIWRKKSQILIDRLKVGWFRNVFLEALKIPKTHFEIIWPLVEWHCSKIRSKLPGRDLSVTFGLFFAWVIYLLTYISTYKVSIWNLSRVCPTICSLMTSAFWPSLLHTTHHEIKVCTIAHTAKSDSDGVMLLTFPFNFFRQINSRLYVLAWHIRHLHSIYISIVSS